MRNSECGVRNNRQTVPVDCRSTLVYSLFLSTAVLVGCGEKLFQARFAQVKLGMSRAEVTALLGKPATKQVAVIPASPMFGPVEQLTSALKAGSQYEEWMYANKKNTYYIWFGSAEQEPASDWRVIGNASFPTGVAF